MVEWVVRGKRLLWRSEMILEMSHQCCIDSV